MTLLWAIIAAYNAENNETENRTAKMQRMRKGNQNKERWQRKIEEYDGKMNLNILCEQYLTRLSIFIR